MAVQFTKRALYRGMLEADLQAQIDYELYLNTLCFSTDDFREGMRSFLEKREPVFKEKWRGGTKLSLTTAFYFDFVAVFKSSINEI